MSGPVCHASERMTNGLEEFSSEDYQEILNFPNHLVIVISLSGRLLKTNNAHKEILGWRPEDTVGKDVLSLVHEADHENLRQQLKRLSTGADATTVDFRIRCLHKGGGVRWISWTGIAKGDRIYALGADASQDIEVENALLAQRFLKREYESRFQTFFQQSTFAMVTFSLEGRPLEYNTAWLALFGLSPETAKNYLLQDALKKLGEFSDDYLQRVLAGESQDVPAFFHQSIGDRARWIEAMISPVKDQTGAICEVAIILKDVSEKIETQKVLIQSITERKAVEEQYRIISDRLTMAVKAGQIGIWEWVPGSDIITWDDTVEKIFGLKPGTFPWKIEDYKDLLHPVDRGRLWQTISDSLASRKPYVCDHRIVRPDGEVRWIQSSGMGFYDELGNPYHMMGTTTDITERKQSENDQRFLARASELLLASIDHKAILRALCEHAVSYFCDGVCIDELLEDGQFRRLLVVSDPETEAKITKFSEAYPERFESDHPLLNTLLTGRTAFYQDNQQVWEKLRLRLGDAYVESLRNIGFGSSIIVRLKGRDEVLGTITFFTLKGSLRKLTKHHHWLSEELAGRASMAFQNALIHQRAQEAIRARDEFLSIASHELKTPLQSLTLQNQMRMRNLQKGLIDSFSPEQFGSMVEADLRHLMRIKRLIDDMLDISKLRAGKFTLIREPTRLAPFLKDVVDRFRPQLDAVGCQLRMNLDHDIEVNIDSYRTEQVLVNLLTNAVKYGAGKPVTVSVSVGDCRVKIFVQDLGVGIGEEDLERIFEKFERAVSRTEISGLGLGLYISRLIMELQGGVLFAQSRLGEGATFIMELPLEQRNSISRN
jgi:PAS domain S-box-containing protein